MRNVALILSMLGLWVGCSPQGRAPRPRPSASGPSSVEQAQREIFSEMVRVVLGREPSEWPEFSAWLRTLAQGASLEGVYRGLTLSDSYRRLESQSPSAAPAQRELFLRELESLGRSSAMPRQWTERDGLPLEKVEFPNDQAAPAGELVFGQKLVTRPSVIFGRSTVYTLKRVLGSEALRVFSEKKRDREALVRWYAEFAARLADTGVDYGLKLRNVSSAQFHADWARTASDEQILWEILNRLHRLLNSR